MRTPPLLAALLLALAALAVPASADEGPDDPDCDGDGCNDGDGSGSGSDGNATEDDGNQTEDAKGNETAEDDDGNQTDDGREGRGRGHAPRDPWCDGDRRGRGPGGSGSSGPGRGGPDHGGPGRPCHPPEGGRWVAFEADADDLTIRHVTVDGREVLAGLTLDLGPGGNATVRRDGAILRIFDSNTSLDLHDNPTGLIRFTGRDGSLRLALPDGASAQADEKGARVTYVDGRDAMIRSGNLTWDGPAIMATGFLNFHVPPADKPFPTASPSQDRSGPSRGHDDADGRPLRDARDTGRVLADIHIGRLAQADAAEVLPYDDIQVNVTLPEGDVSPESPIRVQFGSELDEGKTIVLHLDPAALASAGEDLVLRYFDVHDDGSETEVVFRPAASLEDVLDAGDDRGQPEYWVVEDPNGLQVLVSVPHWSVHAVTIASISSIVTEPSVWVGAIAGVLGSVGAAAVLLWPRRRREDED